MMGVAVYGVISAEKQVFEQELVRRQQLQEAKRAVHGAIRLSYQAGNRGSLNRMEAGQGAGFRE